MIRYKKVPGDIFERLDGLTNFFLREANVVFAYLFGGLTQEEVKPLSDVDLALYFKNPKRINFLSLFNRVSEILGTDEIDLVILNTAPVSLTGRILQKRKILVDKDPFLRHQYESRILREFFDFSIKEKDLVRRRYGIG
jgi:predicted nucleotidyltransferase